MKKLIASGVVIIAIFIAFGAGRLCVQKVPLGYVGVRSNLLSGGIEKADLAPGYHMVIPGMHKLQLMDSRKQITTMVPQGAPGDAQFTLLSKDKFSVGLDVTIVYSLEKGMAHKALEVYGDESGFIEKMNLVGRKVLTEVLGDLTTEEFYDAEVRTAKAMKALETLNNLMAAADTREYLTIHNLLIRSVTYEERFEARLLEKQLFDQEQELQKAKALKEAELEITEMIYKQTAARVLAVNEDQRQEIEILQAEADAQIAEIEAEAQYSAETLIAEAERNKRVKIAEGELAKTEAKAKGDKEINASYAGLGGQLLLVQKMVENISFGEVEINTNRTNPFAVDELLTMLGADMDALDKKSVEAGSAPSVVPAKKQPRAPIKIEPMAPRNKPKPLESTIPPPVAAETLPLND